MEDVVYVLGAGFSAELGIPVVSNFLEEARDLYRLRRDEFAGFEGVFERLRRLGHVKSFMKFDLDNVEEVLSLLQMESELTGGRDDRQFGNFVRDVVVAKTPQVPELDTRQGHMLQTFGSLQHWREYIWFAASLLRSAIGFTQAGSKAYRKTIERPADARYTLVTLNYDMVLETAFKWVRSLPAFDASEPELEAPKIYKLHGCVERGEIVAPTANKTIHPAVQQDWEEAHRALRDATHVRFVGYSLPATDVYVQYLLGAALSSAFNPKRFDVLCLDPHKDVRVRYEQMFESRRFRFVGNTRTSGYLSQLFGSGTIPTTRDSHGGVVQVTEWIPPSVERVHHQVFGSA